MAAQTPQEHEAKDRGLFDCFGKKEEKHEHNMMVTEPQPEHKPGLMEKLHRTHSSSSSSSEEEVEEEGVKVKRKKKKGGDHKDGDKPAGAEAVHPEEKKGILEKIKEKLPSHHKAEEGVAVQVGSDDCATKASHSAEAVHPEEKKGLLEKIKEKLPGHHKPEEGAPAP